MARLDAGTGGRPLSWVSGHLVYARDLDDPWAVFKVPTVAYELASLPARTRLFHSLRDFAEEVKADFQILRLSAEWDPQRYLSDMLARPPADAHTGLRERYVIEQADTLGLEVDRDAGEEWDRPLFGAPQVFVAVSLRDARQHRSELISDVVASPRARLRALRDRASGLGLGRRDELAVARLEQDHAKADELFGQRVLPYLPDARAASLREIEWLVRRAWCRGLGEPFVSGLDEPGALRFERNGQACLRPDTAELLSWGDYVRRGRSELELVGELGTSWQAGLVAQSLPPDASAPGPLLELMFEPVEALGFPVDVCLNATFVTNARAKSQIEGKITDADESAKEEAASERGASDETIERTDRSRDARNYFRAGHPRLDCVLSVICGAPSPQELKRRAGAITAAYKVHHVTLRQPIGQQLEVFWQHLPGQQAWTVGYTRHLTPDQVGAMAPLAAHKIGSRRGYAWGHTRNGTASVFRWDPGDASRNNKASGVLLIGDSGSGKTATAGKMTYEAFLDGGRIFDLTCKPADHHWHESPDVAPHVETIELREDPALAGLLDPWLTAPPGLRVEAADDFLRSLFPERHPPEWESRLRIALTALSHHSPKPSNIELLAVLRDSGNPDALRVAEHLEAYAQSGLSQLGFADLKRRQAHLDDRRQITHVMCEGLQLPKSGVDRSNWTSLERRSVALVQLLGLLCMGVMTQHPDALKLFVFDEAHVLTQSPLGVKILEGMQRLGRSRHVVPVLGTQNATDIGIDHDSVSNIFGSIWAFRPPDDQQAKAALELMKLEQTPGMLRRLTGLPDGAALLRDHDNQSEVIQVKHVPSFFDRVRTDRRGRDLDAPVG